MKKILLSLFVLVFVAGGANLSAQKDFRSKYRNFSYVDQTLNFNGSSYKSDLGFAFTSGRSYIVTPVIGNFFRVGIDATWFDINYTNYSGSWMVEDDEGNESSKTGILYHMIEASVHAGLSVHFTPISKLGIHGYFRYAPTYSVLYDHSETTVVGGYVGYLVAGGALSYGLISVGAESRWGSGKFSNTIWPWKQDEERTIAKGKFDTSALRVYVSFRF